VHGNRAKIKLLTRLIFPSYNLLNKMNLDELLKVKVHMKKQEILDLR